MKYKFIILIISSKGLKTANICYKRENYYKLCKNYIIQNTNNFKEFEKHFKYFFIQYNENLKEEIKEDGNRLLIKGKESIKPGIFLKTIKAIEYINEKYEYDFILRTNLSSMWNFDKLLKLYNKIKPKNFYGGNIIYGDMIFASGTFILISKDISHLLLENINFDELVPNYVKCKKYIQFVEDDKVIGQIMNYNNIEPVNIKNIIDCLWKVNPDLISIENNANKVLYFRLYKYNKIDEESVLNYVVKCFKNYYP